MSGAAGDSSAARTTSTPPPATTARAIPRTIAYFFLIDPLPPKSDRTVVVCRLPAAGLGAVADQFRRASRRPPPPLCYLGRERPSTHCRREPGPRIPGTSGPCSWGPPRNLGQDWGLFRNRNTMPTVQRRPSFMAFDPKRAEGFGWSSAQAPGPAGGEKATEEQRGSWLATGRSRSAGPLRISSADPPSLPTFHDKS